MELLISSVVLLGEGFTPQVFTSRALREVIDEEPDVETVSAAATVLRYPSQYEILVQPKRVEVKHGRPSDGEDRIMQTVIKRIVALWPLAELRATGLNFVLAGSASAEQRQAVFHRFAKSDEVTRVVGDRIVGASLTFTTESRGARVSITVDTEAQAGDQAVLGLRVNVHYDPVGDVVEVLRSQGDWYRKSCKWAEGFFHGS